MTHELKTWPKYFEQVELGAKTFEIRKYDRAFHTGDILILREYDVATETYTGKKLAVIVSYTLSEQPFVPEGYICMAIHKL
jgi:hypothetical protein